MVDITQFDVGARTPALAEVVAERLREMITNGALAPGARIKEAELAEAMQVSRGPVREAISLLTAEGLVVTQRHRGARVIRMDRRDIEEISSLRLALERLAMTRAASRLTPELVTAMDDVLHRMALLGEASSVADVVALDLEFHDLVYEAAAHSRLDHSWALIRSQVSVFLHARTDIEYFRSTCWGKHQALREVLVAGDEVAAAAAVEEHIGWTLRRLVPSHVSDGDAD